MGHDDLIFVGHMILVSPYEWIQIAHIVLIDLPDWTLSDSMILLDHGNGHK